MKKQSLTVYQQAFKAYDIRNIWQEVIDEAFAYILGRAVGAYLMEKHGDDPSVLLGGDTRTANNTFIQYFLTGLQSVGVYNTTIADFDPEVGYNSDTELVFGTASSSVLYYLTRDDFDLGVSVTASHNGPSYVGCKLFDSRGEFLASRMLYDVFAQEYERVLAIPHDIEVEVQDSSVLLEKRNRLFDEMQSFFAQLDRTYSFVVDFSHGAATSVEKDFFVQVLSKQGHDIHFLCDTPDGRFPSHSSDTLNEENYHMLQEYIAEHGLDFGVMFDGDADRIGVVTAQGRMIPGDIVLAALMNAFFSFSEEQGNASNTVVYDVMCTRTIGQLANNLGVKAVRNRMGRMYINAAMRTHDACIGGELSGHYMFGAYGNCELVLLALFYIMYEAEQRAGMDNVLDHYYRFPKTPSLNLRVRDPERVLEECAKAYSEDNPERIDGINILTDDYMITIRQSQTEPLVRVVIEANTKELRDFHQERLMRVIEPYML